MTERGYYRTVASEATHRKKGRSTVALNRVKDVRWAAWWQKFRRGPWYSTIRGVSHWRAKAPAPWVAVLGPDGSGKTSILTGLKSRLAPPFNGVIVCHWRPGLLLASRSVGGPVTDPHGKPPRGLLTSLLKLGFLFLDWKLGFWYRLTELRARGTLVLFDRNYYDLLIDTKRYRYGAPLWAARLVGWFVPRPDLVILLDAPPEVLQARKREVPMAETVRQREAYLNFVCGLPAGHVVDASRPLGEVQTEVAKIILDHVSRQSVRRPKLAGEGL